MCLDILPLKFHIIVKEDNILHNLMTQVFFQQNIASVIATKRIKKVYCRFFQSLSFDMLV